MHGWMSEKHGCTCDLLPSVWKRKMQTKILPNIKIYYDKMIADGYRYQAGGDDRQDSGAD